MAIKLDGQPVLTADQMRAAERAAIEFGVGDQALMERAGKAVAAVIQRVAAGAEVLVLCGPGNNGGDGYVAARSLKAAAVPVRVVAVGEPNSHAAKWARSRWDGPIASPSNAEPAPIFVDALFGTGLSRPLKGVSLSPLADGARYRIAVDVPSGLATDDGSVLTEPPIFDLTLALGAAKPVHLLQPAVRYCGRVRIIDIGLNVRSSAQVIAPPKFSGPGSEAQKYTRGMVAVVAGAMAGASELASLAAMRSGAGYVMRLGPDDGAPHALVRKAFDAQTLMDDRIGAIVVGPGLGRDFNAKDHLHSAMRAGRPLIIDGDALHLIDLDQVKALGIPTILTPHSGEFDALFGKSGGSKVSRAERAAERCGAVIIFKGSDTVIAHPDGRVRISTDASHWLSTAGTGDVLAGTVAATLAGGLPRLEAAAAAVWMNGEAARRLGKAFIADDLAAMLSSVRTSR